MRHVYWVLSGPKMSLGPNLKKTKECGICAEDVLIMHYYAFVHAASLAPSGTDKALTIRTVRNRNCSELFGFEKLKKCADIIRNWPTTSTSLEKSFGQISTHHKTQSGFIHCETLLALHNSMGPSQEFMKAFCATCRAHNIKMD